MHEKQHLGNNVWNNVVEILGQLPCINNENNTVFTLSTGTDLEEPEYYFC